MTRRGCLFVLFVLVKRGGGVCAASLLTATNEMCLQGGFSDKGGC